jgi:polar amino acid transport system substrate-binding protein
MRLRDWFYAGVVGLLIGGCGGMQSGASSETKAALAPTGRLRVACVSPAAIYATKDPITGELQGVAVDLGEELSRRVGVPFEPVGYGAVPALIAGAKAGEWDVALMGINAERATAMDFSGPYMEVELGYLVRAGVPIAAASDVDKAGIRIGVPEKGGADVYLSRTLKNAVVVRAPNAAELYALLAAGKVDVIAATKTALFAEVEKQPGSRVLDGRILSEPIGMGVPKGRATAAAAYVGKFVEAAKAEGLVKSAIERAGLRGVVVAPPK